MSYFIKAKRIVRGIWIQRFSSLKFTNQILFIFLLISLVYLILDFIITRHPQFQIPLSLPQKIDRVEELTFEPKPYSYYLEGIQKRELFGASEPRSTPVEGAERTGSEMELANLNLIGIVSGVNPQAIIEEKKTNKTYFLNKGDYLGQFKVEEILPGKVILIYGDQRWELNL
jgi:type II secretory pathway component PulC